MFVRLVTLVALVLAATATNALGHDDLLRQIAAVTRRIEESPGDAALYLRRGSLRDQHGEWDAALADYEVALRLQPSLEGLHVARASTLAKAGFPNAARAALDTYLVSHPDDAHGLVVRARISHGLKDYRAAAADYSRAIALTADPRPELFIERADAQEAAGPEQLEAALVGIEEGLASLGPIVTLSLHAIDLERRLGRFDAALQRLDRLGAANPRKESTLLQRAQILEEAGRPKEAAQAYRDAIAAAEQLPEQQRTNPATMELVATAQERLNRLRAD